MIEEELQYEEENDLEERDSFHLKTVQENSSWSDYEEDSDIGFWADHVEEEYYSDKEVSRWEQMHFISRGPNYPSCQSKKENLRYYRESQSCYTTDHHSYQYCTECKFNYNSNGWYKVKPTDETKYYCNESEEESSDEEEDDDNEKTEPNPEFVLIIIYDNQGVYLSKRINKRKVMYNLLQTPCGKVERNEHSMEAILRETLEEAGVNLRVMDVEYLFNDPKFNCDVYMSKLPEDQEMKIQNQKNMDYESIISLQNMKNQPGKN